MTTLSNSPIDDIDDPHFTSTARLQARNLFPCRVSILLPGEPPPLYSKHNFLPTYQLTTTPECEAPSPPQNQLPIRRQCEPRRNPFPHAGVKPHRAPLVHFFGNRSPSTTPPLTFARSPFFLTITYQYPGNVNPLNGTPLSQLPSPPLHHLLLLSNVRCCVRLLPSFSLHIGQGLAWYIILLARFPGGLPCQPKKVSTQGEGEKWGRR